MMYKTLYMLYRGKYRILLMGGGGGGQMVKSRTGSFGHTHPRPSPPIRSILQKIGKIQGKFWVNEFWPPLPLPFIIFAKIQNRLRMA